MDGSGARGQAEPEAAALDAAVHRLERLDPGASARRVLSWGQIVWGVGLIGAIAAGAWWDPMAAAVAAYAAAWITFGACVIVRFAAAAASLTPKRRPAPIRGGPAPIYTILCPVYREARMLAPLTQALARLRYPRTRLDIKLILEADDIETRLAARRLALGPEYEIVVVPVGRPRTKPRALNYALARARGSFVTIYDAEDRPDPRQLEAALDAFARGGAQLGVVQAPLVIDNAGSSWIASQFAAEYAIQFRELLPLYAGLGLPLPLGGTSNHFRRHALTSCGGWDPFNVTEDADIGYRLALGGWRMGMIDPPTYEEAPVSLGAWLRQRSRWIKGHIQTWLVLMRRPGRTWRGLGSAGFWAMQLQMGAAIIAAFAHAPLLIALATAAAGRLQISPADWALAGAGYLSAMLCAGAAAGLLRDARLALAALTMPVYWPLATFAAVRALAELLVAPHFWAKTEHGDRLRTPHARRQNP